MPGGGESLWRNGLAKAGWPSMAAIENRQCNIGGINGGFNM
jgi:hypothetical protein